MASHDGSLGASAILFVNSNMYLHAILCVNCVCLQVILDESQKFFKLLELLGKSDHQESALIFVDKQESAGNQGF